MNAPTLVQFIAVFAAGHFLRGHDASGSADQERGFCLRCWSSWISSTATLDQPMRSTARRPRGALGNCFWGHSGA